ncbi:MAG: hypothetical protein ACOYOJ_08685 [Alsobacter sp.]
MNDRRLSVGALLLTCLLALAGTAAALTAANPDLSGVLHLASTPVAMPVGLVEVTRMHQGLHW